MAVSWNLRWQMAYTYTHTKRERERKDWCAHWFWYLTMMLKGAEALCMHIHVHIHNLCVKVLHTPLQKYTRGAHTFTLRLMNFSQLLVVEVEMMVAFRTSTKANSFEANLRTPKPTKTHILYAERRDSGRVWADSIKRTEKWKFIEFTISCYKIEMLERENEHKYVENIL